MKHLFLYLLFQFSSRILLGQVDSATIQFMYQVLQEEPGSDTITYTDKLNNIQNRIYFEILKKHRIYGYESGRRKAVRLRLSREDRRQLHDALVAAENFTWKDSLFVHSRMISTDSLFGYVFRRNREIFGQIGSSQISKEERERLISKWVSYCSAFQFAKPVFLKEGKIVLFYFIRLCGDLCGIEDLSVYRLENGIYKKWLRIGGAAY